MVITGPDHTVLCKGSEASVASYVEFLSRATDISFNITSFEVHSWGTSAYVKYDYDVSWTDNKKNSEKGADSFFLSQVDGKWLVVMRMVLPGS